MNVLIAFDINVPRHGELKDKLLESGFFDFWYDENRRKHELPDTTLWIDKVMNPAHAKSLFDETISELNNGKSKDDLIVSTKFVAVQASLFLGMPSD